MFVFTYENLEKIELLKKRYPTPKALTLPLLWMVQYQETQVFGRHITHHPLGIAECEHDCCQTTLSLYL